MQYLLINFSIFCLEPQVAKKLVTPTVFENHVVWGLSTKVLLWLSAKCCALVRRSKLIMLISGVAIAWETLSRAQSRLWCFRSTKRWP